MLKHQKSEFYLKNKYWGACQRIAGARTKLSKTNIKNLVRELKLPSEDEEAVFRKVYAKTMNVYAALKI